MAITRITPPWQLDWGSVFDAAASWLAGQALTSLNDLWDLLKSTALTTPDVTSLAQVRSLNATSMTVVDGCYILAVLTAGIMVMAKDSVQVRYGIGDLAPRLVFGYAAASLAPFVTALLIGLSNGLTQALTGEPIASGNAFAQLQAVMRASIANPADTLLTLTITVVICGLSAALMVNWIVRIGVVVVLAGIAPLALACHGLPQTDAVARLWWRAMAASLGTVTLQAVALHVGLSILLDPDVNRQALGLGPRTSAVLNLFIVVCLLWVVVKIPGVMRRLATSGSTRNVGGDLVRLVAVRQLTGRRRRRGPVGAARRAGARRAQQRPDDGITGPGGGSEGSGRPPASAASRGDGRPGRGAQSGDPPRPATPWPTRSDQRPRRR